MRYILCSDIHGNENAIAALMQYLEQNNWMLKFDRTTMYLTHEEDVLISLGDCSDRGKFSFEYSYLINNSYLGQLWEERNPSVISLMGNHDIKIANYFKLNKSSEHPDWQITLSGIKKYPEWVGKRLFHFIENLPYKFTHPKFLAAHAYYSRDDRTCIYGPVDKDKQRVPWWLEKSFDRPFFYGHYHDMEPSLNGTNYGIDTLDGGFLTLAIIDDTTGEITLEKLSLDAPKNSQMFANFDYFWLTLPHSQNS